MKIVLAAWLALILSCSAFAQTGTIAKQAPRIISALIKSPYALPDEEISRLALIGSKTGGTKEIGKHLGSLKLSSQALEDTYLRIAVQQGTISRIEAETMLGRLHDVPGFRSTLSKIIGASDVKTKGHLHELKLADSAAARGFKVEGIGISFTDINKAGVTDIDVILTRGGKTVAIEAKDYSASTKLPMDSFRADMDTLSEYQKSLYPSRVIKVFTMTYKPLDVDAATLLSKEAGRRDVNLIYGSPEEQVIQIRQLAKLL